MNIILDNLSEKLHPYAKADSGRRDGLDQIGESADRIKRLQRKHPSNWSFGPFEQNVWFPSVSQDGVVVKDPNTSESRLVAKA